MQAGSVFEVSFTDFLAVIGLAYFIYWMFFKKTNKEETPKDILPPMQKRDFNVQELRDYDGVKEKRILLALLGNVKSSSFQEKFWFFLVKREKIVDELQCRSVSLHKLSICADVDLGLQVYDVSRAKQFYGPGGPYHSFAGHDATRALATGDVKAVKDAEDDTSDLTPSEVDDAKNWEMSFRCKHLNFAFTLTIDLF